MKNDKCFHVWATAFVLGAVILSAATNFAVPVVSAEAKEKSESRSCRVDSGLIVLVSDLHVSPKPVVRQNGKYRFDTTRNLDRFVADVLAMNPRPAAVLILGDLVETPSDESYRQARRLLDRFDRAGVKYCIVAGNHDRLPLLRKTFPQCAEQVDRAGNPAFYLELPEVRFAFIDTSNRSGDGYYPLLSPEAKEFILEKIKAKKGKPIFIGGHHAIDFKKDFPELVSEKSDIKDVQGWIHGHLHSYGQKVSPEGIPVLAVPSVGFMDYGDHPIVGYCLLHIASTGNDITLITNDKQDPRNGRKTSLNRVVE